MKEYYHLIKETRTQIQVTGDIETPNAECVSIEIIRSTRHPQANWTQYKVTHEDGRTYKAFLSSYQVTNFTLYIKTS